MLQSLSHLPRELVTLLKAELMQDETVLWASQPLSARWTVQDSVKHVPIHKWWYLLIPGLSKFISSILSKAANNILYVVTNQRALLVFGTVSLGSASTPDRISSIPPEKLLGRQITLQSDNSGDLLFPQAQWKPPFINGQAFPKGTVGFYGIPDVKDVDELIRRTFETKDSPI